MAIFESSLFANLLKRLCNSSVCDKVCQCLVCFSSFENSVAEETYKLIKKLEYFYVQHTLLVMSDKIKYM